MDTRKLPFFTEGTILRQVNMVGPLLQRLPRKASQGLLAVQDWSRAWVRLPHNPGSAPEAKRLPYRALQEVGGTCLTSARDQFLCPEA